LSNEDNNPKSYPNRVTDPHLLNLALTDSHHANLISQ